MRKKSSLAQEGGYWVDENNNKWDATRFSHEEAMSGSRSMVDCRDCIDCADCVRCSECTFCVQCSDCVDCYTCENCVSCLRCEGCDNCENCDCCGHCDKCFGCVLCTNCIECSDCRDIGGQTGLSDYIAYKKGNKMRKKKAARGEWFDIQKDYYAYEVYNGDEVLFSGSVYREEGDEMWQAWISDPEGDGMTWGDEEFNSLEEAKQYIEKEAMQYSAKKGNKLRKKSSPKEDDYNVFGVMQDITRETNIDGIIANDMHYQDFISSDEAKAYARERATNALVEYGISSDKEHVDELVYFIEEAVGGFFQYDRSDEEWQFLMSKNSNRRSFKNIKHSSKKGNKLRKKKANGYDFEEALSEAMWMLEDRAPFSTPDDFGDEIYSVIDSVLISYDIDDDWNYDDVIEELASAMFDSLDMDDYVKEAKTAAKKGNKMRKSSRMKKEMSKRRVASAFRRKSNQGDIVYDIVQSVKADAPYASYEEAEDNAFSAIENALIYTRDIVELAMHYGAIDDQELINRFYDDFLDDIMSELNLNDLVDENDYYASKNSRRKAYARKMRNHR